MDDLQSLTVTSDPVEHGFSCILDRILDHDGAYDIPLRSIFEFNLQAESNTSYAISGSPSAKVQDFSKPIKEEDSLAALRSKLLQQVTGRSAAEQCKLPPSFLTSFIRRCFVPDLEYVDFPQALTALDYVKDLESRRVNEVAAVLQKLEHLNGLHHHGLESSKLAGVIRLKESIIDRSIDAAALYSQVYLSLRQWTMINEMMLTPFNKGNCLAMLNTLFPPKLRAPPARHVSIQRMANQRHIFLDYIKTVEKDKCTDCLHKLIANKRYNGSTRWPDTHYYIEKYLVYSNDLITACHQLSYYGNLEGPRTTRRGKQDSGISISSDERPASSGTNATSSSGGTSTSKFSRPHASTVFGDGRPTLEKIGKELRKIKSRGNLNSAAEKKPHHTKSLGALRKIKSLGRLKGGDRSGDSLRQSYYIDSPFDVEEFKRKRINYETKKGNMAAMVI
ncbi:hypothetical protein KEM54_003998 [Ascosphaera aggregata]|nr:hypothetical protein KEM54_003998 [Ascosphaera aggregata]